MLLFSILTLVHHLRSSNALLLPVNVEGRLDATVAASLSFSPRSADILQNRSLLKIIWSCLATLFTCAWIAVHPNIPAEKDTALQVLGRRCAIMGYLLLAPEMVILWAARQHYGAKEIAKKHKPRGWTRAHGFFVIMGGFALYDSDNEFLRTLDIYELEALDKEEKVRWPSITEEQINDRSKADILSKGFVVVQTTWFIVGCIGRAANRLAVTELEVVTLAFSALNGVVYWLWWNKPLDVRCHVAVYLKTPTSADELKSKQDTVQTACEVGYPSLPKDELRQPEDNILQTTPTFMVESPTQQSPSPVSHPDTPNSNPLTPMNSRTHVSREVNKHGFIGEVFSSIWRLIVIFFKSFQDMLDLTTLRPPYQRVPTFYCPAPSPEGNPRDPFVMVITFCVTFLFGAIHCAAWNADFPSIVEHWMWRASALAICTLPILLPVISAVLEEGDPEPSWSMWRRVLDAVVSELLVGGVLVYMLSRLSLLVLPFLALRKLPPSAYVDLNWLYFIPSVS